MSVKSAWHAATCNARAEQGTQEFCVHAAILSDQSAGITVFLPTNEAINATFNKFGLDMKGLLQNQHLCTEIVQYHILPSPIEVCTAWRL